MEDNKPPQSTSETRRGLATILFKSVKSLKELPDGLALGYPNQPAWMTRMTEFVRLEQESGVPLEFEITLNDGLLWLHWRGDQSDVKREMAALSPDANPLGRITMLKDAPLVSIIVQASGRQGNEVASLVNRILVLVRHPLEIVVLVGKDEDIGISDRRLRVIEVTMANFQRGLMESKGGILGFIDVGMSPDVLPQMIESMRDYPIAIGSDPAHHPVGNLLAKLFLGRGVSDYLTHCIVLRRSVLTAVPVMPRGSNAYFVELLYAAQQHGLRINEVPCQHNYNIYPHSYARRILSARL